MTGIKAFVGHSFTEQDEGVVRSFLKFFDQLEGLLEGFEWTHAKNAEPKELADKVLETIDGCNTLIAICTRKELAVSEEALKPALLNKGHVKTDRNKLLWKTSDWVIQEIGLAVGRGFSIIILLEDGCRKPGGIQGDVEYIPFSREAPEKAQGQLLEMVKALSPPATSTTSKADSKSENSPTDDKKSFEEPEAKPDASWDIEDFDSQYFWAIIQKNAGRCDEINNAFLNSVYAKDDESKIVWHANIEKYKIICGQGGKISVIRECLDQYPENPDIIASLAAVLSSLDQVSEAAQLYVRAANNERSTPKAAEHLGSAAYFYAKSGNESEVEVVLDRIKGFAVDRQESRIARSLKSVGEVADDTHLAIEAMEAIARIDPDDHENRFSLAYAHSQIGNSDLALHHYSIIPSDERSSITWNNLGVAYQNLSVPGRAISAYKKAASEGETLAMSNLAYRYMNAGFFDEASVELRRAMSGNDPHKNVGEAYAQLDDLPTDETKSVKEIEAKAAKKLEFYRDLSIAILEPTPQSLQTDWTGPKGPVSLKLTGNDFSATWEYQVEGNTLSGFLASKPRRYRIELKGKMVGRRAYGKLKEDRLDNAPSILGDVDNNRTFAVLFSEDLQSARVVENLEKRHPSFYELQVAEKDISEA